MKTKTLFVVILTAAMLLLLVKGASANSGFPALDYPSNQYGMESRYYDGPWGERMVYGAYGYFPNFNGQPPYGYRTYGYMYTPMDLRYGATSRFVSNGYNSGFGGNYGGGYGNSHSRSW
jgi:hypothetical protein